MGTETGMLTNSNLSSSLSTFRTHPVGATLNNLGNTCFMNAVLQCITHTVPLVEKLRANSNSPSCPDEDGDFCSFCALRIHVDESIMKSGLVVTPRNFAYNLSKISSYFQPGEQQDAHEFLCCFLDSIHNSYLKPISNGHQFLSSTEENPVNQVFGGRLRSQLRCVDCGHCSDTYEPIVNISLEIDHVDNLTDALKSFTKVEMIDDPCIKFTCEGCKAQVSMEKQLKIEQPSNVIALHLKRFANTESSVHKISKFVEYPLELDLMPFLSSPCENGQLLYELYAVVVHSGSCYYGHYYCNIRTSPTAWYQMNDSLLDVVSESNVLFEEAYILFYIKKDSFPWFSCLVDSQKAAQPDMDRNGSPSSVLDRVDHDDTSSSARETSCSISREAAREVLEKDEVSSPHTSISGLVDELQTDKHASSKTPDKMNDSNDALVTLPSSFVKQPSEKPDPDQLLSQLFCPEPLEDEKENCPPTEYNMGSKSSIQKGKYVTDNMNNADKSLARVMRGMPSSRRLGLLACLHGSPEPTRKRPSASKSDPPFKRGKRISSDLLPLNGKDSAHNRSTKAKSLSPYSIRRCLIEEDSDMLYEFGSGKT